MTSLFNRACLHIAPSVSPLLILPTEINPTLSHGRLSELLYQETPSLSGTSQGSHLTQIQCCVADKNLQIPMELILNLRPLNLPCTNPILLCFPCPFSMLTLAYTNDSFIQCNHPLCTRHCARLFREKSPETPHIPPAYHQNDRPDTFATEMVCQHHI